MQKLESDIPDDESTDEQLPPEPLCTKFVLEVLEIVRRVKLNRGAGPKKAKEEGEPSTELNYFIHIDGIKDLLKKSQDNFRIYLGISVGQYYHERAHAEAQIACLQRFREAYEQYLQEEMDRYSPKARQIPPVKIYWGSPPKGVQYSCNWPIELIIADSSKVLNEIDEVELNFADSNGQCAKILLEDYTAKEEKYIDQGKKTEATYRELLCYKKQRHQNNVTISYVVDPGTLRWSILKNQYANPLFMQMVNYLEKCFKKGAKNLQRNDPNIFQKGEKPRENDIAKLVKVNDLAYILSEIVMVYYVLFKSEPQNSETPVLMYPGQLNKLMTFGKDLLGYKYNDEICQTSFIYLRNEEIDYSEKGLKKQVMLFSRNNSEFSTEAVKFIREKIKEYYLESKIMLIVTYTHNVYPAIRVSGSLSRLRDWPAELIPNDLEESQDLKNFVTRLLILKEGENKDLNANRSLYRQCTSSYVSCVCAAYRLSLLKNCSSIYTTDRDSDFFEKIAESKEKDQEFEIFHSAHLEIRTNIYIPFVYTSYNNVKNRISNQNVREFHIQMLLTHYEQTQSNVVKLCIAARLEDRGEYALACSIYKDLLESNIAPTVQIANLMRQPFTQYFYSFDAIYAIGYGILETNLDKEILHDRLVYYIRDAIHYYLPRNIKGYQFFPKYTYCRNSNNIWDSYFHLFSKPDLQLIGLACIELVNCSTKGHPEAYLYLSKLYITGVLERIKRSTKIGCILVENACRIKIDNRNMFKSILNIFIEDQKTNPEDMWLNIAIANLLTALLDFSKSQRFSIANARFALASDYYLRTYNAITGDIFYQDKDLVICLRDNMYLLANKIHESCELHSSIIEGAETLRKKADNLLVMSANLGHCLANYLLAKQKTKNLQNSISEQAIKEINKHFVKAIEWTIIEFDKEQFQKIHLDYQTFVANYAPASQNKIKLCQVRINEFDTQLTNLARNTEMSTLVKVREWCSGIFCSAEARRQSLNECLEDRGVFGSDDSVLVMVKIITFLSDYYTLTRLHRGGRVLFKQLQADLNSISILAEAVKREVRILINFYLCIIDNKPDLCKESINQSPRYCKAAFISLAKRMQVPVKVSQPLYQLFNNLEHSREEYTELQRLI